MIIAGVIAEFNPMHDGHRYLLSTIKEQVHPDVLVVVLSTYFSSRGLPSLENVATKTRLALEAGADLVIALPAVYTMQSADYFALHALQALKTAGVNVLCFGSESADLETLQAKAEQIALLNPDVSTSLARNAAAQDLALEPNDILAIQYIRWCKDFGIEPYVIERDQNLKSATQTRADFFAGIEQAEDHLFEDNQHWPSYYPYLRYMLLESDPQRLNEFFLVEEGIEYRLIQCAQKYNRWNDFLEAAISKTYSRARIQRTCMMILMQISKTEVKNHSSFHEIQVLGMNPTGGKWLKSLPEDTPIASKFSQLPDYLQKWYLKERRLYTLVSPDTKPWQVVVYNPEKE